MRALPLPHPLLRALALFAALLLPVACKSASGPGRLGLPREQVACVPGVFEHQAFHTGARTWILAVDGLELPGEPACVDRLPGSHVLQVRCALPASLGHDRGTLEVGCQLQAGRSCDLGFERLGEEQCSARVVERGAQQDAGQSAAVGAERGAGGD